MQAISEKVATKSVRDLIEFISFAEKDIYIDEFYENDFDLCVYNDYILVKCKENTCKLTRRDRFVDATSLSLINN